MPGLALPGLRHLPAIKGQQCLPRLATQHFILSARPGALKVFARIGSAASGVEAEVGATLTPGLAPARSYRPGLRSGPGPADRPLAPVMVFPLHDAVHQVFVAEPVGRRVGDVVRNRVLMIFSQRLR